MPQKSNVPTRKVTVGALLGALSIVVFLALKRYGITFSEVEQGSIQTLLVLIGQYITPEPEPSTDADGEL